LKKDVSALSNPPRPKRLDIAGAKCGRLAACVAITLLIMQGSPLVMAASSGFAKLFDGFGIRPVMLEDHGRVQESGAIYFPRALEKSPVS
ncbi:hypothetical protein ACC776_37310, partial [Rhizobium johnstonii]